MSGGSYCYAYSRVRDFVDELESRIDDDTSLTDEVKAIRRQFAAHVRLVAAAMRAIEWVDSSDWGSGDEVDPIRAVLGLPLAEEKPLHEQHIETIALARSLGFPAAVCSGADELLVEVCIWGENITVATPHGLLLALGYAGRR